MSRWIYSLILAGALLCAAVTPPTAPARADDGTFPTAGAAEAPEEEAPGEEAAPAPRVIPSKADIRGILKKGDLQKTEEAYLTWASYWRQDDPSLIVAVERPILLQQYRDGDFAALVALVQIGDAEAGKVLRSLMLSGKADLPSQDMATAVKLIGEQGDRAALNALRMLLYSDDAGVVNAAIDALGGVGDKRIVPELIKLFDGADLERSVLLTRALDKLGAAKDVQKMFKPQLQFPLPGVRERAALVLAVIGDPSGWASLRQMLTDKKAPYYPLALSVLGKLPADETTAFVTDALAGSEQEQLAALQSIALLAEMPINDKLIEMMTDTKRPVSVRLACIELLAARKVYSAAKELRALAGQLDGDDAAVRAAAIMALAKSGYLYQFTLREMIRQRFDAPEPEIARAARAALLSYGLTATGPR